MRSPRSLLRWASRLSLGIIAVPVTLALFLVATGVPLARGKTAFTIAKVAEAHFQPGAPGRTLFVLVEGNDGRAGLDGARADALHVIGLNPTLGKATMINIPRDTYVPIPGHGHDKINAAYTYGGPALEAQTVGALLGVPIPIVITTNFDGFMAMVNELGGIDVDVPIPEDDSFSGAKFSPGMTHMDGTQALAFARDRHIPDGDLRRTEHQGLLILAAFSKLRADRGSAASTFRDLAVLGRHAQLDGIGLLDLYRLARFGLGIDPANVRTVTMPALLGNVGAASVVFAAPSAGSLFADFADDAVLESH